MPILISNENTRIGWIGTGIMGRPMCGHVLSGGYRTSIYNRTKSKAEELINKGAVWCTSPEEVAKNSDIIITILGYPEDVREVYFGKEGIFTSLKSGTVLVDMTTTEPSLSIEIYNKAKDKGVYAVDAPVSGGDVGAINAKLSIMVGGDEEIVSSIIPLLRLMGHQIVYEGGPGAGQHTKVCNQITVGGVMTGICEALLYSYKAGLDPDTMIKTVCAGAASTWLMENLGPKIIDNDFKPGFFVEHFIKDLGIAIAECKRMNLDLPGLKLSIELYEKTRDLGYGKLGTQALFLALKEISEN
ncbi:MAG: NAD(P)-dependent oxidoreductase [Thermodesulfobacteriota bacterium]